MTVENKNDNYLFVDIKNWNIHFIEQENESKPQYMYKMSTYVYNSNS